MSEVSEKIEASFKTGFVDKKFHSGGFFESKLIMNDIDRSPLLSNVILEQLSSCNTFTFQIAFITGGGLALLKSKLRDLRFKGIEGRLLTSDYLHFNRPKIFRELMKVDNLEVKITKRSGFHAKGYLFEYNEHKSVIIGSSNLTATALRTNHELNVIFHSTHDGKIIDSFERSFEEDWEDAIPLSATWIKAYQERWEGSTSQTSRLLDMPQHELQQAIPNAEIIPNKMQKEALENLEELRMKDKKRAVLISATGTGKTYLSVFDVQKFNPRRCLYIAHREQILLRSAESFQRVLGLKDEDIGFLSGTRKDFDQRFMFSTVQSLIKEKTLNRFSSKDFDYIIVDEVHRAGAKSYEKIFSHFQPKFMLGMSATPERTDEFNVFELFDNNIAYEIRLQRALEEHLLVPFHYYGVSDFEIDGELIDDQRELSKVEHSERMKFLLEKIEYFGYGGEKLRGLIFCSRKSEGRIIANQLGKHGYKAVFLSGEDPQSLRIEQIKLLELGELDYIVTVDIFNEGIDIPSINQVVMLRQTKSSIIFIQQLGRGLRLDGGKEYLTVIDFIGNYRNNFLIPMALSGDQSYNKDTLRKFVSDSAYLTGLSSVNFEEVAKQRIYQSINRAILGSLKDLKDSYRQLKQRLNRIPFPTDFQNHHAVDPSLIMKKMTYSEFLRVNGEEGYEFSLFQESFLKFFGNELLNGVRLEEIELLDSLFTKKQISIEGEIERLSITSTNHLRESVLSSIRVLTLEFFTKLAVKKYNQHGPFVITKHESVRLSEEMNMAFQDERFKSLCEDLLKCARTKHQKFAWTKPLKPYMKYGRKDICRLLNWEKDETSTIYGYRTKHNTCPIFITYHKSDDVEASTNYGDEFLNRTTLRWFTRSRRTLETSEVKQILNHKKTGVDIHIFVKKDDDEGSSFYYLGQADVGEGSERQEVMQDKKGNDVSVVTMKLLLRNEIPMNVHDYFMTPTV
jgi:superfamily II DNA or RNA helicase/HKD family nuclease